LSQLVTRSPRAFPTGTRPEAIAPTTAPSAKGVRIEESEKTASTVRRSISLAVPAWTA
jgi:hypothetical protein